MDRMDYHHHHLGNVAAVASRLYQPEEEDDSSIENTKPSSSNSKGGSLTPGTNTGRWSNEEHQRFLEGLERFGTGSWKRITELVATRSCTQVRTHAQKYFLAQQKPADGSSTPPASKPKKAKDGSSSRKKALRSSNSGEGKRNKKFKYEQGGVSATAGLELWLGERGGAAPNGVKRGLSGMSLLAQAAMVDPEFERMDETAEEYEKRHGRPTGQGDNSSSSDDDDDSGDEAGADDISVSVEEKKLKTTTKPSSSGRKETFVSSMPSSSVDPKEEIHTLREQLQLANQTLQQMRQDVTIAEARAIEAIEGRNIAINECRELQEMNNQLKAEHRRMAMGMEKSNGYGSSAPAPVGSGGGSNGASNPRPQTALSAGGLEHQMHGLFPSMSNAQSQQMQHQDQIVIEVLQSRLKEAELRYHQVTESLARQTGVLTDQHRAVLELNSKLEGEMARRQALEIEVERLKRQGAK